MNKTLLYSYLAFVFLLISICVACILCSFLPTVALERQQKTALASKLLLIDFCLSTESRHTRHLTMPELLAPFQDLPAYHEHFPSSTFLFANQKIGSQKIGIGISFVNKEVK